MLQTFSKWTLKRTDYKKPEPTARICKCSVISVRSQIQFKCLLFDLYQHWPHEQKYLTLTSFNLPSLSPQAPKPMTRKGKFLPENWVRIWICAGIFALERIRAQLSQKCTFKSVWDPFKTLCKSDRASNCAARAQVFIQTRMLKYAVTHSGFAMLQTLENQANFATWTGICTFGGPENMGGGGVGEVNNPCNPDRFHPEWNSASLHFSCNRNYHDKKCQWPIW